jgi:hypothetical protein
MIPTMSLPASRNLAEWWGQLASLQPKACWLAYLYLHHVEARVRCVASRPLERLQRLILRAVELMDVVKQPSEFWATLDQHLFLGEPALRRLVKQLADAGLLTAQAGGQHVLSELGRHALADGVYPGEHFERRVFPFVERVDAAGERLQAPHFLPLQGGKGEQWPVNGEHYFDPAWLTACIDNSSEWKRDFGFPADVLEVIQRADADWQSVIIDRTERVPIALATTGEQLLGFAIHVDSWRLLTSAPVISLTRNWPEVFPMLATDLPIRAYQQAWRNFAQERNIAAADADACSLTVDDNIVHIAAPAQLSDPLRRLRSEATKGHAGMLVGEGSMRKIVRLSLEMR